MPRVCAYLTMENPEGFFVYDHLTYEPLRSLGWEVSEVPWSRPTKPWDQFDAVVIRSPWDYQNRPQQFLQTLDAIEQSGTRLFNPLSICRWNLDKVYLRDLQDRGVPIVPSVWMDPFDAGRLDQWIVGSDLPEHLVIKPTIGANSDGIIVFEKSDPQRHIEIGREYANQPCIVQPFLQSIETIGEYSLFFFGGQYSHAVIKRPKAGDFRVQEEHGGTMQPVIPDASVLAIANQALQAVGERLLYARVDIVELMDQTPAVMELELIEPSLYFPFDDESPQRFATAFNDMWEQPR